jgi:hypothetical protein
MFHHIPHQYHWHRQLLKEEILKEMLRCLLIEFIYIFHLAIIVTDIKNVFISFTDEIC